MKQNFVGKTVPAVLVFVLVLSARFPSGDLLPEATRLRTEALLALGHKPAALAGP
jgi:hypothetical protein